jgi:hypothetical protein
MLALGRLTTRTSPRIPPGRSSSHLPLAQVHKGERKAGSVQIHALLQIPVSDRPRHPQCLVYLDRPSPFPYLGSDYRGSRVGWAERPLHKDVPLCRVISILVALDELVFFIEGIRPGHIGHRVQHDLPMAYLPGLADDLLNQ